MRQARRGIGPPVAGGDRLEVGCLDLEGGTLTVAESITRGSGGQLVSGPPKSSAGNRTVTLPSTIADLLERHLSALGFSEDPAALVSTNTEVAPIHDDNWRRRVWLPATRAAGCEGAGFHDLLRLAATALVLSGVDIKTAQVRPGHSDPRMTLAVYASAPVEADRSAAERLESRFSDGGETESTCAKITAKIAPQQADIVVESPETRSSGGRNPR